MENIEEKRGFERWDYNAPIVFSYFNKNGFFDAQALNCCTGGMCFRSGLCLSPKTTLYIRTKQLHSHSASSDAYEEVRTVTLAEVKWCEETFVGKVPDTFSYKIGVKYFPPIY